MRGCLLGKTAHIAIIDRSDFVPFDPTLAAIRYGMGLSPIIAPPSSVADMMTRLRGPDTIATQVPIPTYSTVYPSPLDFRAAWDQQNEAEGTAQEAATREIRDNMLEDARDAVIDFMKADIARATYTEDGFRERLARFWADHFTVRATTGPQRHLISPYIEEAIRPNVAGQFGDMLVAVVTNSMMILFLDQQTSVGPNSATAQRRDRGLNENLAREVLELHTLGVGGSYSQTDVREFAELLTGLNSNIAKGAHFRIQQAEPGSETVLGVTYGGEEESMDNIVAVLRDLAVHPDTARHLARKLAVHFIGPEPDLAMIEDMAVAYLDAGGDLTAFYDVMLNHDTAWAPNLMKVKPPFDFVASAFRALAVPMDWIMSATIQNMRGFVQRPLSVMGQDWQSPVGPDGWPESDESWITPQGMAGRITWAMQVPKRIVDDLPDPRDFVYHALGPTPPDPVIFAAGAAETVSDGIGIVLASSAFQRR